jgi:hypothetical protein
VCFDAPEAWLNVIAGIEIGLRLQRLHAELTLQPEYSILKDQ